MDQTLFNWVKAHRAGKFTGVDSKARERRADGDQPAAEVKYAFIERQRRVWPISVQCRVLQVSVAGYHEHVLRRASRVCQGCQRRYLSDDALLVHIKAIHAEKRGGYGWPRTWRELLVRRALLYKSKAKRDDPNPDISLYPRETRTALPLCARKSRY